MDNESLIYWLDSSWVFEYFKKDVFEFQRPWAKYVMLVPPIAILLRFLYFNFLAPKLKTAQVKSSFSFDATVLLGLIPPVLFVLALELFIMALSGPMKTNEKVETWTEGIDIMLVLDISQSMEGMDLKPNRLEAAKKLAIDFIDGRNGDRIGVIVFRGEAFSKSPITSDYDLLKAHIEEINFDDIQKEGTAIGAALATSINRMHELETKSKIIILLSDGEQTAGNIEPVTAAELAYSFGIKTYTVGLGRDGEVPYMQTVRYRNLFTGKIEEEEREFKVENNFNEKELKMIAEKTEGRYFRATNNKGLAQIFTAIDEMEKHEVKEERFKSTKDFYEPYLYLGILMFLLWLMTKSTFLTSALHD